ncbi:MAG: FAD-binding protein [Sphaerochaeta sp.]|jgi:succinate dehydrogenase/fumarate reductase flavoprotein subunit|uniref:FAD-binding protein n=1 Tax=Sphaerochaeta sp. TaxID=1972642 RepID=UPI002FC779ED
MNEPNEYVVIEGVKVPLRRTGALVIGTGSASLSCAVQLKRLGFEDLLIVTDNRKGGTSRNTGSDKQTYYRLSDASPIPDSPYAMVESYTRGGAVHGDVAFIEAQNSLRAFYNLVSLGVGFPTNRYGGYTGYKTDHDPSNRGTSLGPYTSREMVRKLNEEVDRLQIPVLDRCDVVRLLVDDQKAMAGALVLDKDRMTDDSFGLLVILAPHVVLGTGGPAGFYAASVYPKVHTGSIGLAMEIGAEAANLTESQFGIGSISFRWNLSGSYQQVLPRYVSTDQNGNDPRDFLVPYFSNWDALTHAVFLKGYQWPFDASKIPDEGSSLIDLLVYQETQVNKRRVFLDFRTNPTGNHAWSSFSRQCVHPAALGYLDASKAWASTPIERLKLLNPTAIELYAHHGIDLSKEMLEIDVCAQHNNGGLYGDIWWESTNITHLYPIGEVNGSHGVARPGGSALNAGQVGALRAAQRIVGYGVLGSPNVLPSLKSQLAQMVRLIKMWVDDTAPLSPAKQVLDAQRQQLQHRMSEAAGPLRHQQQLEQALSEAAEQQRTGLSGIAVPRVLLPQILRLRHMLIAQQWYLYAIAQYLKRGGGSRGSYLVLDHEGRPSHPLLPDYRMKAENLSLRSVVQVISFDDSQHLVDRFDPCRPVPTESFWFERVWKEYREQTYLNASRH